MIRRICFFLLCCSFFSFAQTKHPFTFDDMMKLKRVGEPVVSPDGKWVAFSAVDVDLEKNSKTPHLWIIPVAGGDGKRLTPETGSGEDRVRFSPDGKRVIFEASPDGSSQIYVQDFDTATSAQIHDLFFAINKQRGTTIVVVTHNMALAEIMPRVITLTDGRVLRDERRETGVYRDRATSGATVDRA